MEKEEKVKKIVKYCSVFLYLIWFLTLIFLQIWYYLVGSPISLSSLMYWTILVGWFYVIWIFKLASSVSFKLGLFLFVISAIFSTLRFLSFEETIMRLGFIGFLVGIVQALLEYRKEHG